MEDVDIPTEETTYWNRLFKLVDVSKKRHIVEIEPVITSDLIHHAIAYHCEESPNVQLSMYEGLNDDQPDELSNCGHTIAFWVITSHLNVLHMIQLILECLSLVS